MAADITYTVTIGASGTGTISIRTRRQMTWIVSQISVELATAPSGATCVLRKNGYLVTPIIITGDAAAGDPPVTVLPSDVLTLEFAGCTVGQVARALVFYDEVRPPQ